VGDLKRVDPSMAENTVVVYVDEMIVQVVHSAVATSLKILMFPFVVYDSP
jgi:hypothetical protein